MPRAHHLLALLAALSACDGVVTPPRDAAPPDALADALTPAIVDAPTTSPTDVPLAPTDVPLAPMDAPAACAAPEATDLLRALRAPRPPGVSAVAAPGLRFDDLRAPFDAAPAAMTLLAQARTSSRRTVPTLAAASSAAYQTVASLALAAALVAWHDRDATAARTALDALAACAITPAWLRGAPEIPIYLGASLVDLAAAADLLAASPLPPKDIALGRAHLGRAVASVAAWLQSGGLLYMAVHNDNHGMRLGAGLAAAAMLAPADAVDDEVLGYALALMDRSVAQQTGGAQGWAEGTTYFAYGFESAAPALYAMDRAWTGADARCVSCPGHRLAPCASAPRRVTRPSRDPLLRDVLRWGASMETPGGWLVPTDDSRLMGAPSPLFERVLGATTYAHWSPTGPTGSTGGSVNVGPLVALALASPPLTERLPRVDRWPAAGTGRTDAGDLAAFLNAEPETARQGVGHERPDVLALHVVVGDALVLGGSGYRDYDGRAPYARADAASVITVEGVLPRDLGAAEAGPVASLRADGPLTGSFSLGGVSVTRALTWEGGALVVEDRVEVSGDARDVAWHWHLRGTLDPAAWTWSVGAVRCAATQTGATVETARESAPHYDDYSRMESHPVLRQRARLAAGSYTLRTRVACTRGG